jgi:hypothetical protein
VDQNRAAEDPYAGDLLASNVLVDAAHAEAQQARQFGWTADLGRQRCLLGRAEAMSGNPFRGGKVVL